MYEKCILLISLCLVLATVVTADIRNGYAPDLPSARQCLQELNRRLMENPDMSESERRRINAAMKKHLTVVAHYELTEALLRQMRMISPDMYDQMDQLTDKRGRLTDIYVRFIPEEMASVMLSGVSFFQTSARDVDANQSRFGEFTVSIDIWICETALNLLAHEFGHTKYIVPNLAAYRQYYRDAYTRFTTSNRVGHSGSDASGRMAYAFGHQFLRDRRDFRKASGDPPQRVATVIRGVRRGMQETTDGKFSEPIASSDSYE
ncbi:MAG TPA: hypothetical protein VK658_27300 [Chryseolinea sp.]|nr:hypothetical protein [Chryseolinea sp.]